MLHVVAQIGEIVSADENLDPLSFLVPDGKRFRYIVGVNFRTRERKVQFSIELEEPSKDGALSKESLQQYAYTGAEKGNRPQFSPTTGNLAYVISQVIPNLLEFLPESDLKEQLAQIVTTFFEKISAERGKKSQYILAADTLPFELPEDFFTVRDAKKKISALAKQMTAYIQKELGVKDKETLYTVLVDGKALAKHQVYRQFLISKNLESAFEKTREGVCSVCGKKGKVTQDTTRFFFKFYITDKWNFASNFDKANFYKSVSLCSECYRRWLFGERWIDSNLQTRLGGFSLYLLPEITWPLQNSKRLLRQLKELPRRFNEMANLSELLEREKRVQDRLEKEEPVPFIWNFLFYRKDQSALKALLLIREVPPSRIQRIYSTLMKVEDVRQQFFPEWTRFDLSQIYWIVPLRKSGGEHKEYRKLLNLYHDIFTLIPQRASVLYRSFVELARVHYFRSYAQVQIGRHDDNLYALARDTVKWNLFMLFLKYENLLEGDQAMETAEMKGSFPQGLEQLFQTLGYTPAQQGLALLGYVIGVIANAQRKEGLESKPVMNKISYQGMSDEKTIRLFGEMFDKIRQYRKHAAFAERWLATAISLYQMGKGRETMTSDERLFYLLSGYSFQVMGASGSYDAEEKTEPKPEEEVA